MRYKTIWIIGLLVFLSFADGMGSTVKKFDIMVELQHNGTALIEERWLIDVDNKDAKTEWYVTHNGLDGMRIEQLSMEGYIPWEKKNMPYQTLSKWDLNASRMQKAGKCGLSNNGREICWGFGDYGLHEYIVRYHLTNLVKSYDTCDGFNHCFVHMNCRLDTVQVTIKMKDTIQLSTDNVRRWAFGFEGHCIIRDNSIIAWPNNGLANGSKMIIMLEFKKGIFEPATTASETWEERKQRALSGSDFIEKEGEDSYWVELLRKGLLFVIAVMITTCLRFSIMLIGLTLFYALRVVWWMVSLSPLRNWLRRRKLGIVKGHYYRDIKPEWTLAKNKMVIDELSYIYGMSNRHLIGALLLRLMSKGDVTIVKEDYKGEKKDMLKVVHPTTDIDIEQEKDDLLCQHVLRLLTKASGDDLILQPNEFKRWCKYKINAKLIKDFLGLLDESVNKKYIEQHAGDLFGLKAFLEDFSLLNERSMMEVELWDQYMIYAEFFGIADKVKEEMGSIWPEYSKISSLMKSLDVAHESVILDTFSSSIYTATSGVVERAAIRSFASAGMSGFSSSSSSGGGGGASGGGGGGGR